MIKIDNSVVVSRGDENLGTYKYMGNSLYLLHWYTKEWEEYDDSFNILTEKEIQEVKEKLGVKDAR
jgi:hypothetical protein